MVRLDEPALPLLPVDPCGGPKVTPTPSTTVRRRDSSKTPGHSENKAAMPLDVGKEGETVKQT